ncbi:MAG: OB-fold nucleic acid binding domain-containing protein [Candidatus Atribacteria bacterium]|nr:OB-fold nucleic acid binding domain-containing protein [Candidatus Atribacteria bacterium]
MEKEMIGLYISDHPVRNALSRFKTLNVIPLEQLQLLKEKVTVRLLGAIMETRKITAKNGKDMYFITLEDETGSIETIFFPNKVSELQKIIERENVLCVEGKVDTSGTGVNKVIVNTLIDLNDPALSEQSVVHIEIPRTGETMRLLYCLRDCLHRYGGRHPVVLHLVGENDRWSIELGKSYQVNWNQECENAIMEVMEELEGKRIWLAG